MRRSTVLCPLVCFPCLNVCCNVGISAKCNSPECRVAIEAGACLVNVYCFCLRLILKEMLILKYFFRFESFNKLYYFIYIIFHHYEPLHNFKHTVFCLLICPSVCLSICLSVHSSVCLSICPFVCLSICLFVCLSICLSVHLSVCLFVHLSDCPSV
jgi:hypothetical protein